MIVDRVRLAAGLVFTAIGLAALIAARQLYGFGDWTRIGPGGFPALLGALLALLGVAHLATARIPAPAGQAPKLPPLRVLVLVPLSVIMFGLLVDRLGLVATLIASTAIACGANATIRRTEMLLLCLGLAALGAGLFVHALGLPFTLLPAGLQ